MKNPNREGPTLSKVSHIARVLCTPRMRGLAAHLDVFTDINIPALQALTGRKIESLLIDFDAHVAPPYGEILPENLQHIDALLALGVRLGVLSNCKMESRHRPLQDRGVPFYTEALAKPQPNAFLSACKTFGMDPKTTFGSGDDPTTDGGAHDVLGGFILVDPIAVQQEIVRKIASWRKLHLAGKSLIRDSGITATRFWNMGGQVITSADIRTWKAKQLST